MEQFELNFEAGLTDQFPSFYDCLRASVYNSGKPFKNVAADLDLSSSYLSRMMNEADDGANFPVHRLPDLICATGDLRPIYWLVETLCADANDRRKRALDSIADMLPRLQAALKQVEAPR